MPRKSRVRPFTEPEALAAQQALTAHLRTLKRAGGAAAEAFQVAAADAALRKVEQRLAELGNAGAMALIGDLEGAIATLRKSRALDASAHQVLDKLQELRRPAPPRRKRGGSSNG